MSGQILLFKLPSSLLLEKLIYDDGTEDYFLVNRMIDRTLSRSVVITREEFDALLPLATEVKE